MAPDPPREVQASPCARPPYEPPRIVAYDETALMNLIGPAVACASWSPTGSTEAVADEDEDF